MGFLILLRFALLSIDFLAWPVIALGFPLYASIRAIETGSMYDMRKLVIYWTLFSIISLFEYAFVKIIEWIPFWSCIKLVVIFWLVIPRFHGSSYAYQSFVRPFLVVNLQEAIDSLYKLKRNKLVQEKKFLDLAEKYIQENSYEALEKLIATKMELKEHGDSQKDTQVIIEPEPKNVAAAPKQIKELDSAQKDKEMLEAHEITSPEEKQMELKEPGDSQKDTQAKVEPEQKNVAATQKQIKELDSAQKDKEMLEAHEIKSPEAKQVPHPRLLTSTTNALWVPKETTYAAAKTREVIIITPPPETSSENSQTSSPLRKVESEWHCRLCQINTGLGSKQKLEETVQKPELWCNTCKLKLLSEIDVAAHLKGKRHVLNVRKLAEEETSQ
ncbi:hypothetical protein CASFOL_038881 [Castilleja foliolosa]|uniref:HVA22-like protein n=1 Tax=Castilleja foliolosa TaxID=1961234 RepID=A0ABD3BJX7_9LAMI